MHGSATGASLDDASGGQSPGARVAGILNRWVADCGTLQQLTRIKPRRELSGTWSARCLAGAPDGSIVKGRG